MKYPRRNPIPEAEIPREQCTIVTRNTECSWHRIVLHRKGNVPSHYTLPCTCSTSQKVMRCDVTKKPILHLSIPQYIRTAIPPHRILNPTTRYPELAF
jgi:hypothetical protein